MEKKQNYSRKREAILFALKHTTSHPTAEWIYEKLKPEYPDLSLGTVYKNLARFKSNGIIISVGTVNGQERFDADVTPHSHFICTQCGAVLDVKDEFVDPEADDEVSRLLGGKVLNHQAIFSGICENCLEKLKAKAKE